MLFNSTQFLAFFLPLTIAGYYLLAGLGGKRFLLLYLTLASVVFYSFAGTRSLPFLVASVALNYVFALQIFRYKDRPASGLLVTIGVVANLACLGWFKYANFGLSNLNYVLGTHYELASLLLPLGISFYTFKQIVYLIDVHRGEIQPGGVIEHAFAVIFFPQLIAGPIVTHQEIYRQLLPSRLGQFATSNLVVGLSIFAVGLFKRTVIADSATPFSNAVFDHVSNGDRLDLLTAWSAALCYTLQLYFDFSGYSDMAIGAARMFGFKLPINFYSPLKAVSIIDFWRSWHITLQRIIVRLVFQPLLTPLSRISAERNLGRWSDFALVTIFPSLLTFVLVGLWHGAGWTFVIFGLIHGVYISINSAWRLFNRKRRKSTKTPPGIATVIGYHLLTFTCIVFANVLFRSESLHDAIRVWSSMLQLTNLDVRQISFPTSLADFIDGSLIVILLGYAVVFLLPNSHQFFGKFASVIDRKAWMSRNDPIVKLHWRPTVFWAVALGGMFCMGVVFMHRVPTKFIYFNF